MKYILVLTLLISNLTWSQTIKEYLTDDYLKKHWSKASLMFIAGAADGQVETLQHHYSSFKEVFPNANDEYWNPNISWKNKWKNGDKNQGEKFFGSSTIFVATTDGYHATRMVQKGAIFTAVTIEIGSTKKKKKKFKHYVCDFIFYSGCYTAGFYTTYGLMY